MKKLIASFLFLFAVTSFAAPEGYFDIRSECYIEQGRIAYCQACNPTYRPIFCEGHVQGRTYYGSWLNAEGRGWVNPGQCMTGQVYSRNPIYDPLVYADANVYCRF